MLVEFAVKCKEVTSLGKRNFNKTYVWQANTEKTLEIWGDHHKITTEENQ